MAALLSDIQKKKNDKYNYSIVQKYEYIITIV